MLKVIKGAKVYAPEYLGINDVLVVHNKISVICKEINLPKNEYLDIEIIDGSRKILAPGFIDNHVHIIGGGGEGSFKTRTPEIKLTDITIGGITTVVGCLGTDGVSRSMDSLLAKARGLEEEGITTYIYTGSYRLPIKTITGDVMKDIISVDKIIGVGEIAISDHRSSQPDIDDIKKLAADARVAGILSGKCGIVDLHVGGGRRGIETVFEICSNTEIPYTQFIPTHLNRNLRLLNEAVKLGKAGGYIDFTTSTSPVIESDESVYASEALSFCIKNGVPQDKITFSSDGQGSMPNFNEKKEFIGLGVGKAASLYDEVRKSVLKEKIPFDVAIKTITSNPAEALKLKNKGRIEKNFDADLVLIDEDNFEIDTVIAMGKVMVRNKKAEVFGTFE